MKIYITKQDRAAMAIYLIAAAVALFSAVVVFLPVIEFLNK